MKKYSNYFIMLFVLFFTMHSCQKNTKQITETTKKGLLWQISKKGSKTSYLYGTMHIGDKKIIKLSETAIDELDKCEVMAGELVFDEKDVMGMMSGMFMGDTTLEMLLSEDEYQVVHKKLEAKMGVMAKIFERIKPIFISVLLNEDLENPMDNKKPSILNKETKNLPLDLYLQKVAKEKNKEVVGLETVAEQMAAFNSISLKEQAKSLYETIQNDSKNENSSLDMMIDLYCRQEIDSLYMLTTKSISPNSSDKLLVQRNKNMADRMEKIMATKSLFTAVGAAHLAGSIGLIEIFRQRGYQVKVVK